MSENVSKYGSLDCRTFEDRIHQILDDRLTLTGDELLMEHAARCADCRKVLGDYQSVDDSVKLLPSDIAAILAEAELKPIGPTLASRRMMVLAALAAMIVISLNIIHAIDRPQKTDPSPLAQAAAESKLAIASPTATPNTIPASLPSPDVQRISPELRQISSEVHRITPDSSPFSPEFSFVSSMPSINLPVVPTWDDIAKSLDPLEPVLNYSSRIPAVQPVHCLNAGINLLKRSFSKSERKPDLGFWVDSGLLAAA